MPGRRMILRALLLLVLALTAPAHAVRLAENGPGQVVIVPLYNTQGGNDTLLRIAASSAQVGSAIRLQFPPRDFR